MSPEDKTKLTKGTLNLVIFIVVFVSLIIVLVFAVSNDQGEPHAPGKQPPTTSISETV